MEILTGRHGGGIYPVPKHASPVYQGMVSSPLSKLFGSVLTCSEDLERMVQNTTHAALRAVARPQEAPPLSNQTGPASPMISKLVPASRESPVCVETPSPIGPAQTVLIDMVDGLDNCRPLTVAPVCVEVLTNWLDS